MPLRPKQTEANESIKSNYLQGIHRQVVAACTGFGKAVLLSHIPETMKGILDGQTLVLVHREELIDQNIEKLQKYNPTLKVSKEKAKHVAEVDSDIIVASVQTLGRNGTKRLDRFNWDNTDKIITDECHHATSQGYLNIYEKAGVLDKNTKKLHVGFTATPNRSDGSTLAKIYDKIVFSYPLRQAIEEGWLVDVRGHRIATGQSIDAVSVSKGELDASELEDAVDNNARNQLIVKTWIEHGQGRQTIGFTAGILHAQHLAEMFQQYGVNAVAIWGDDPDRAAKLQAFRSGQITILLNCALLIEGFDMWQVACILLASPVLSVVKYTQELGRGTRLEEGCPNLLSLIEDCSMSSHKFKRDCLVFDFCDNSKRHSLTTLPTLFGMPAQLNLNGKSVTWAASELESLQAQYTHVDFSTLLDIDKVHALVEAADLFAVKIKPEVEMNSTFTWNSSYTGGYKLMLPDKDWVSIEQNLLDTFEIKAYIKNRKFKGERPSLTEAFNAADGLVIKECPESIKVIKQEAEWHKLPMAPKQLKLLKKLMKGKPIPPTYTRGEASKKISELLARKEK